MVANYRVIIYASLKTQQGRLSCGDKEQVIVKNDQLKDSSQTYLRYQSNVKVTADAVVVWQCYRPVTLWLQTVTSAIIKIIPISCFVILILFFQGAPRHMSTKNQILYMIHRLAQLHYFKVLTSVHPTLDDKSIVRNDNWQLLTTITHFNVTTSPQFQFFVFISYNLCLPSD